MNKLPWFRLYSEMVDNDKVRLLAFEDRWHFVALLCCKAQGVFSHNPATLDRRIAVKLGLSLTATEEVKRRLIEADLIGKDWHPKNWDERQFLSDSDPTNADRQKRHRDKKKQAKIDGVTARNGTVTESNGKIVTVIDPKNGVLDEEMDPSSKVKKQEESTTNKNITESNAVSNALRTVTVTLTDTDAYPLMTKTLTSTDVDVGRLSAESTAPCPSPSPANGPPSLRAVKPPCPYEAIRALYHEVLPELRTCRELNKTRKGYMAQRWQNKPGPDLGKWRVYFEFVRTCPFLMGKKAGKGGLPPFRADLEWLIKPANFVKVVEGKYQEDVANG